MTYVVRIRAKRGAAPVIGRAPVRGRDKDGTTGSSRSGRRGLALAAVLIVSALMSPAVQAGPTWVFFTIGLNGKTALVAENITFNPFNSQYYYTFAVANTTAGGARVDGFFVGVGNMAAALAGGPSFGAGAAGGCGPGVAPRRVRAPAVPPPSSAASSSRGCP